MFIISDDVKKTVVAPVNCQSHFFLVSVPEQFSFDL